jgi:hypothetical protein
VPGAITATLGTGSLIYALTRGSTNGWTDPGTLASFAAAVMLLLAFVPIERASRAPVLPRADRRPQPRRRQRRDAAAGRGHAASSTC